MFAEGGFLPWLRLKFLSRTQLEFYTLYIRYNAENHEEIYGPLSRFGKHLTSLQDLGQAKQMEHYWHIIARAPQSSLFSRDQSSEAFIFHPIAGFLTEKKRHKYLLYHYSHDNFSNQIHPLAPPFLKFARKPTRQRTLRPISHIPFVYHLYHREFHSTSFFLRIVIFWKRLPRGCFPGQ